MNAEIQTLRRKLPIGYQSFADLRKDGCYYVDKTPLIRQMIEEGRYYFLSRPRRFGKSLLVDPLQELFEGNEALIRGLDIHPYWNGSVKHPVVRLTLDGIVSTPEELQYAVLNQLYEVDNCI
ncbi:MAG: AAA family ATPase [Gammaproteobacteria bacterium]|nr:AAA family ATPase [Gammaproteobacteria bacterium]MCY4218662.1 AAA family ATPase [Gammaproteobacteria bacterium]